ncbi:LysR family transcriptional regulator [Streptomyces sp. NRRL B-24572]|uniref:LysR family transcriptional regulator n=1 Tax=Streptomyces sp. NRRL B-24572 TaxID=1962156 RepID=UPI000A381176|nr:LysR substrate-binding domain-containing protein [Streptomyces sp. NRRL B-24572]
MRGSTPDGRSRRDGRLLPPGTPSGKVLEGHSDRPVGHPDPADGEVLAEYGKRVFLLAQEEVAAVQQVSGPASGRPLVGGSTTVGTHLLPPLLARFAQQHPGIDCDIFVGDNEAVLDRLVAGDIGIVVVAGVPTASRLVTETVLDERLALISEHAVVDDVRVGTLPAAAVRLRPRPARPRPRGRPPSTTTPAERGRRGRTCRPSSG